MTKYQLRNSKGKLMSVFIDESAKKEFKELLGWSDDHFNLWTMRVKDEVDS